MAIESNETQMGTPLPTLTLHDLNGEAVTLTDYREGNPLIVMFVANHCPYVKHVETEIGAISDEFRDSGVRFVAIGSNDIANYPDDDVPGAESQAQRSGWAFPYLMDGDQVVAKELGAACTPDFFVYDAEGLLNYRGALDQSSPKNGEPVTGDLLRDAISRTVRGESVPRPHRPALGCGIKWLPGNQPKGINLL